MKSMLKNTIIGALIIPAVLALSRNPAFSETYTIKSKDNLIKIANRYNMSIGDILEENPSITNKNEIKMGQNIEIPEKREEIKNYNDTIEIGDIGKPTSEIQLEVRIHESPNRYKGRKSDIEALIVHSTEGSAEGAETWHTDPKSEASSNYIMDKKGNIVEIVNPEDTAWHVGKKTNHKYAGVELEGYAKKGGFTDIQYDRLALISIYFKRTYGVDIVKSHNRVTMDEGGTNHSDPGKLFDWKKLEDNINKYKNIEVKLNYTKTQKL